MSLVLTIRMDLVKDYRLIMIIAKRKKVVVDWKFMLIFNIFKYYIKKNIIIIYIYLEI